MIVCVHSSVGPDSSRENLCQNATAAKTYIWQQYHALDELKRDTKYDAYVTQF